MPVNLKIALKVKPLDEDGTPEERATFGCLSIRSAQESLTRGFDSILGRSRDGPLVSGYPMAEWLAWNWWRHNWEPHPGSATLEWEIAHRMPSIGEGYLWPNVTIFSDGVTMTLLSKPSSQAEKRKKSFRYIGSASAAVMPLSVWQASVDAYIRRIRRLLRKAGVAETSLDRIWTDVLAERNDPALSQWRKLEAMLGRDPDSEEDQTVQCLIADTERLGPNALGELAANHAHASDNERAPLTASEFEEIANGRGYDASRRECVDLGNDANLPRPEDEPARYLGACAARALRKQENLGDAPIEDKRLAEMGGVKSSVLGDSVVGNAGLSFVLDKGDEARSRLVMRSKWQTGRRFDLARLIADRLIGESGPLHPATRAHTYRQKMQRAFAAEFLSPFNAVREMLVDNDDDEEARLGVAEHFKVSPMTIESLLMNNDVVPPSYFLSRPSDSLSELPRWSDRG